MDPQQQQDKGKGAKDDGKAPGKGVKGPPGPAQADKGKGPNGDKGGQPKGKDGAPPGLNPQAQAFQPQVPGFDPGAQLPGYQVPPGFQPFAQPYAPQGFQQQGAQAGPFQPPPQQQPPQAPPQAPGPQAQGPPFQPPPAPGPAFQPQGFQFPQVDLTDPNQLFLFITQSVAQATANAQALNQPQQRLDRVKAVEPPEFNGRTDVEEWREQLRIWESKFPNVENRAALLVGALQGGVQRMITRGFPDETQWDYDTIKQHVIAKYTKRRIVKNYEKASKLISCRRKGRNMQVFLREYEICTEEAAVAGLTMSSELKGIFALIFSQVGKTEASQVLAGMQAVADQNQTEGVDYETVAGLLQSVSDTHQLPSSDARGKQVLNMLEEDDAVESVPGDDDWQGTLSDDEGLAEEDAEDDQYGERLFALVARYMNKKKGPKGGQKGDRRGAPKGGNANRRQPGRKQESTKKCEHCGYLGHSKDQCYVLHPELVPENKKEAWKTVLANREKKAKDKKVYTCISAHVFTSFKDLTNASPTMVLTDTGAEGKQFVAGSTWTNNYIRALPPDAPKPKLTVPTGNAYRFGPTVRKTLRTWYLPIWWDGRWTSKRLDEVKGNIPGLLTYDLQASMGIVPCPPKDKIYRLTGEGENGLTMEEVKSAKIGGLLALDLIGRDSKSDARAPPEAKRALRTLHVDTSRDEIEDLIEEVETPRTTAATALVYSSNKEEPDRDARATPEEAQQSAGTVQTILVGKRTPTDQLQSDQNKKTRPSEEADEAAAPVPEPQNPVAPVPEPPFARLRQPPEGGDIELSDEDTEEEEEEETQTLDLTGEGSRPKYLDFTEAQLRKLHKPGHMPADRMVKFLVEGSKVKWTTAQKKEMHDKCVEAIAGCKGCAEHGTKPMAPAPVLREIGDFNECVVLDLVQLRSTVWALSMACSNKKLKIYSAVPNGTAYTCAKIFLRDWVKHYGMPRKLQFPEDRGSSLHDRGGSFVGADFITALESLGVVGDATPAFSPQSHGQVERANRTLLESLRGDNVRTVNEADVALGIASNVLNSTLDEGGFTAHQQVLGRNMPMCRGIFDDVPEAATAAARASDSMRRLLQIQDETAAHVRQFVYSRRIRELLAKAARPAPLDVSQLKHGQYLLYWRPRTDKKEAAWRGPARCIGWTEHTVYLDHNGAYVSAHPSAVKLARGELAGPDSSQERVPREPVSPDLVDSGGAPKPATSPRAAIPAAPKLANSPRAAPPPPEAGGADPGGEEAPLQASVLDTSADLEPAPVPEPPVLGNTAEPAPVPEPTVEPAPEASGPAVSLEEFHLPSTDPIEAPATASELNTQAAAAGTDLEDQYETDWSTHQAADRADADDAEPEASGPLPRAEPVPEPEHTELADSGGVIPPMRLPREAEGEEPLAPGDRISVNIGGDERPRWLKGRVLKRTADAVDIHWDRPKGAKRRPAESTVDLQTDEWRRNAPLGRRPAETELERPEGDKKPRIFHVKRQRKITSDEYYAILYAGAEDVNRYLLTWESLPVEEQTASLERHYTDIWKAYGMIAEVRLEDAIPHSHVKMSGKWVKKAKVKDGKLVGAVKWTPRGFEDKNKEDYRTDCPTVGFTTMLVGEAIGQAKGWAAGVLDISGAFYQGDETSRDDLWVEVPYEWHGLLKRDGFLKGPTRNKKVFMRLRKDAPGIGTGPRSFYLALDEWLREFVYEENDETRLELGRSSRPAFYVVHRRKRDGTFVESVGTLSVHVDDIRSRAEEGLMERISDHIRKRFAVGSLAVSVNGYLRCDFLGVEMETTPEYTSLNQTKYIQSVLQEVPLDSSRPRRPDEPLSTSEYKAFRTANGQLQWVIVTRPEVGFRTSRCASASHDPTVEAAKCLNQTVKHLRETAHRKRMIPTLDLNTWGNVVYADASLGNVDNSRTQGGRAVNLEDARGKCATLVCRSGKLHRVAQSSYDAETLIAVDACGDGYEVALTAQEVLDGPLQTLLEKVLRRSLQSGHREPACLSLPPTIYSDGHGTVQSVNGSKQVQCKRRQQDVAALREALEVGDVASVLHLAGPKNPVDPLTKLLPLASASTPSTVQVLERMLQGQAPPKA